MCVVQQVAGFGSSIIRYRYSFELFHIYRAERTVSMHTSFMKVNEWFGSGTETLFKIRTESERQVSGTRKKKRKKIQILLISSVITLWNFT